LSIYSTRALFHSHVLGGVEVQMNL